MELLRVDKINVQMDNISPEDNRNGFNNVQQDVDIPEGETPKKADDLQRWLYYQLRFGFITLFTPHFVFMDKNKAYAIKSWRLHQVLVGLMHFLCVVVLITEIRYMLEFGVQSQAASINSFQVSRVFTNLIYKLVVMLNSWWKKSRYSKVFEVIRETPHFNTIKSKFLWRPIIFAVFAVATIQIVTSVVVGKGFVNRKANYSMALWNSQLTRYGRYAFLLDRSGTDFFQFLEPSPISWNFDDVVIRCALTIGLICRYGFAIYSELIFLTATITLWVPVSSFAESIKKGNCQNITYDNVSSRLSELIKLSKALNDALGCHVLWSLAEGIVFYAVNLTEAMTTQFFLVRIDLTIFYICFIANIMVAADIKKQLGCIDIWLLDSNDPRNFKCTRLNRLKLMRDKIGIDLGGITTITFAFILSYGATVVGYHIICAQDGQKSTLQSSN